MSRPKTKILNIEQKIEESIITSSEIKFLDSITMYLFGEPVPEKVLNYFLDNYSFNKINLNSLEAKKKTLMQAVNYLIKN